MRLKSPPELTWDSVTSDLIQKNTTKLKRPPPESDKQSGKLFQGNHATAGRQNSNCPECSFCGIKGHIKENCYTNPHDPKCKMTKMARRNLKSSLLGTSTDPSGESFNPNNRDTGGVIRCGGLIMVPRRNKSFMLNCQSNQEASTGNNFPETSRNYVVAAASKLDEGRACLDSGASITTFEGKSHAATGTYEVGPNDSLKTARGTKQISCDRSGVFEHRNIRIPIALHVESLNMNPVSVAKLCDQGQIVLFTDFT